MISTSILQQSATRPRAGTRMGMRFRQTGTPDHHGALKSMFNDCGFEGSAVTTKDLTDWGI